MGQAENIDWIQALSKIGGGSAIAGLFVVGEAVLEQAGAQATAAAAQKSMVDRLHDAAQTFSGDPGMHLRKVMDIARAAGGSWKSLWFYNYEAVGEFVQFHTTQERRREMTKATNGQLPFSGDSDGHGDWVIYPFAGSLDRVCRKDCPDKDLVNFLDWLDGQLQNSVNVMYRVQNAGNLGGGSGFGPSVDEFLKHVGTLAKDKSHLYSAY